MSEVAGRSGGPVPGDVRPLVAMAPSRLPVILFVIAALVGGYALFTVLDTRRQALTAPRIRPTAADIAAAAPTVPELYVPPPVVVPSPSPSPVAAVAPPPRPAPAPQPMYQPQPTYLPPPPQPPQPANNSAAVVYDSGAPKAAGSGASANSSKDDDAASSPTGGPIRVRAGLLSNPATTIPQGAVIQAVLETALDSTRPGLARAVVSRDVRGFDGTRVLIPRGSHLIGEYKADVARGQSRALVVWTRLVRPDGVIIALESPSADPLGRAGIKGSVNTHFFERFGGAILQSALDVGVGLATRNAYGGTVIVGLPGSNVVPRITQQTEIQPTIKVKQGSSVSVFVARDLDFTTVEGTR